MDTILSSLDVSKYVAACAAKAGVSVKWGDKTTTPCTDGDVLYLPRIPSTATEEDLVNFQQMVKHETAHVTYSDFSSLPRDPVAKLVHNCLEDHRIDWLNDSQFGGDKDNSDVFMRDYIARLSGTPPKEGEVGDYLAPVFAMEQIARKDLWSVTGEDLFTALSSEKGKAYIKPLLEGDYLDVLRNIRNISDKKAGTAATKALAERICKEVFGLDLSKPAEEYSAAARKGEGEGGGSEDGDGDESDKKEAEGEYSEFGIYADHSASKRKMKYTPSGEKGSYMPDAFSDIIVLDHTTKSANAAGFIYRASERDVQSITSLATAPTLAASLRTRLQVVSRDRWEFGKKKGTLNKTALWKLGVGGTGVVNDRVFKSRIHAPTLDVCVQLLIDCSGSMLGEPFEHAAAAATILHQVLSNTLGINTEVLGYTEVVQPKDKHIGKETNTMHIFAPFGSKVVSDTLIHRLASAAELLQNNADGEAFAYGFRRIKQQKEKRKIMVVLSDGSPCGGIGKGDVATYTTEVVKAIENTPVELYGVGLMYMGVEALYKRHVVIKEARGIEAGLVQLLDQIFFN